jgi:serine/threonine-protein kinase
MAIVYRGRDTALDREVAVKLLHPHLAGSAESRARFAREARAVARLAHPGIVEIYDYAGDGAPEAYLVTEFIRGRTLKAYAAEVGFGFPELGLLVGRALCDALVHAHSAGVIHRDLKPENVLVQAEPRPAVKLADFGIARILASDERMTMTGALVGSPHHMAPEIVEGREADARSDLFSLGTILYWLATGRLPFSAGNPTAILRRAIEGDFDDPRDVEPRVSARLAALLRRCLAVDPAERPSSAAELRDGLDAVLAEVGLDRPGEALAVLRQALALNDKDDETQYNIAFALSKLGRDHEAESYYMTAVRLNPYNARAYYNRGILIARSGNPRGAAKQFREAVRIEPDNADFRFELSAALVDAGQLDEGIEQYAEVLRQNPIDAIAHINMGVALARQENLNEAIKHFSQALELRPTDEHAQQYLQLAKSRLNLAGTLEVRTGAL